MKKLSGETITVLLAPFILAFMYIYPRMLINELGEANPWTSYFYMYGFGVLFFFIGIFIILKSGACNLKREQDRFWFKILMFGMVFFASLHAGWIYLALSIPVKGA